MKRILILLALIVILGLICGGCELDPTTVVPDNNESVPTNIDVSNSQPQTEHVHSFVAADCTTPKTCSSCGKTEGEAKGHEWEAATCTQAKTCSACGKTEGQAKEHNWKNASCTQEKRCQDCDKTDGSALGHNYKDGKCTRCNKTDPNDNSQVMVWIPTNGGTKYHSKSNCSNMKDPQKVTKQEAIDMGYEPCKKCH